MGDRRLFNFNHDKADYKIALNAILSFEDAIIVEKDIDIYDFHVNSIYIYIYMASLKILFTKYINWMSLQE